jgi:hypothetical protein
MKRNILLSFLLVGLVVLEWGCKKSCGSIAVELDSIYVNTLAFSGNLESDKPYRYDSISFRLSITTREISEIRYSQNNAVYACDPYFFLDKDIIRNEVNSSREYSNLEKGIKLFAESSFNYVDYEDLWAQDSSLVLSRLAVSSTVFGGVDSELRLTLAYPPTKTDTFQFTFQFFDTEGNIFETTTEPIIITP